MSKGYSIILPTRPAREPKVMSLRAVEGEVVVVLVVVAEAESREGGELKLGLVSMAILCEEVCACVCAVFFPGSEGGVIVGAL